ncbi:hypothetical protein [Jannaschia donghaensis]|uniref:Uncharacterized protein n=1 Tax=Jannaschia donghaensis TaxID=420998 RepID=A0A0M6YG81_9RHOB|nr:hypothetical protein [Jannaschia donghaensis]CTQ48944.1 hypothetical protein JDO7802_00952 [Jannaschia donghaensis]
MEFGYTGDSFQTLTQSEQLGLAGLSMFLGGWILALGNRLTGLGWAIGVFWAFIWLSPQVYYLYYQMIFDGLPWQMVVKDPPGPVRIVHLLTFQAEGTLSAHGKGVLGWGLIGLALWRRRQDRAQAQRPTT